MPSHTAYSLLAMEEGVYSYLDIPAGSLCSSCSRLALHHTYSQCPPWHRIALRLGWAGNIILLGVVVALLAVLVCQNPEPVAAAPITTEKRKSYEIHGNTTVNNHRLEDCWIFRSPEDFQTCLKQHLCEMENDLAVSPLEGSSCKLCPKQWLPHKDNCYWLSEEPKPWPMARDDCSRKRSHLLVVQDQDEKEFIQNITGRKNQVWIGLNITFPGKKWTWVDGSLFNQTLFTILGPAEENSCGATYKSQIQSESCTTHYHWICQKEALSI